MNKNVFLSVFWLLFLATSSWLMTTLLADSNEANLQFYWLGKRDTPGYVHDPSTIIKCDGEYWLFATGRGIVSYHSKDLIHWKSGPSVFTTPPGWTAKAVPNFKGIFWAPDIIYLNGQYLLYYSVSTWGVNTSAIGLVTNPTLNPSSPIYHWTDHGVVIDSVFFDKYNTIDPCVFEDPTNGTLWLTFGSFWSGIKLIRLNPSTGKRISTNSTIYSLALNDTIEASYLYYHEGYYYLFVNWGYCCHGVHSTYNIRIGRSRKITGPYFDKDGQNMLNGGGSLFLGTEGPFIGPGQVGILHEGSNYWLSCHFYDGSANGNPTLAIFLLKWSKDGWPEINLK